MQFFMVLSGFVAYYTTEGKMEAFDLRSGCMWLGRRLARLAALHHVALVVDYARIVYVGGPCAANGCRPLIAWPMNAMFLQGLFPVRICGQVHDHVSWNYAHFNANGVSWFAACLVWISILFPLLYNLRPRHQFGYTCLALASIIALRSAGEIACPDWAMWGGTGMLHPYAFFPLRLLEFWAGMLSAQAATQAPAVVRKLPCWTWVFDIALLAGCIGVGLVMRALGASSAFTGDFYLVPIWCVVCSAACFAAERADIEPNMFRGSPLHALLASSSVVYLAQYTYGTYQFHQVSLRLFPSVGLPHAVAGFPVNVIAAWVVGAMTTIGIETPVMRYVENGIRLSGSIK